MTLNVSNVSFGSKFSEQKAAKFIDAAHQQAADLVKKNRSVAELKENFMQKIAINPETKEIFEKLKKLRVKDEYIGTKI